MTLKTHSADETIKLGEKIGSYLKAGDVLAMRGTLAAGKTTITKGIARALGIEETITSPTFTIVSEYEGKLHLYHIDVYRLDSSEDFVNLGSDEMLYGNGVSIIEWSEKVQSEIPKKAITISLEANEDSSRTITISNWPYGDLQ
ncbi:MAG: tRNA (adenosine(37)-N6)-threonylcarbamoyltransferase complex ATPase subunit type 1 TsaE [Spirochaetaceae bacterium]|nr:tRNA (adenosine(37)-N6)-threonylcarbamoyltransferase complex ATPase subunit type 1 TsaE [Spirochaetaceae bacterium]MDD6486502.1 tRNA (adenosine(37)-N6)-threonylcarbamoyltransferase complex ATPase subunit type 1 TsaE [Spirochaetales bacterium]